MMEQLRQWQFQLVTLNFRKENENIIDFTTRE